MNQIILFLITHLENFFYLVCEPNIYAFFKRRCHNEFHFFFVLDFNLSVLENDQDDDTEKSRVYCSIGRHLGIRISYMDDMKSLYYVMLHFARVILPWETEVDFTSDSDLAKAKNEYDAIRVSNAE